MKRKDESGVILSWFFKVAVVLAVIAVVGFDVGSIIVNNWTLSSSAEDVAVAVTVTMDDMGTESLAPSQVYDLAKEVIEDEDNAVAGAHVVRKGTHMDDEGVVHIVLRRRADTIVTHLIGPLEKQTIAVVGGQAGTN